MIAVIFEVEPHAGRAADYFDIAASLKPQLEAMDGFLSIERFESLSTPGKYLSPVSRGSRSVRWTGIRPWLQAAA